MTADVDIPDTAGHGQPGLTAAVTTPEARLSRCPLACPACGRTQG